MHPAHSFYSGFTYFFSSFVIIVVVPVQTADFRDGTAHSGH